MANDIIYVTVYDLIAKRSILQALDTVSGREKWSYQMGSTLFLFSTLKVINSVVYVNIDSTNNTLLYALDAESGHKIWDKQMIHSMPVITNGMIYISSPNGQISALDGLSGHKKWSYQIEPSASISSVSEPIVVNNVVYTSANNGALYALDAVSGHEEWSYQIGGHIASSLTVADGVVYVESLDGHLYAIQPPGMTS